MAMAAALVQAFILSLQEANDCFPGPTVSFISNPSPYWQEWIS